MTKKSNTPRHKRLDREGRFQAARTWIPQYNEKHLVRGYSNHFAVDLLCAAKELEILGCKIDQKYIVQLKIDLENRAKKTKERKEQRLLENLIEGTDYLIDEVDHKENEEFESICNDGEYFR